MPRSTLYATLVPRPSDAALVAEIREITDEFECCGYPRVGAELRHRGHVVNVKKVRRLMREHQLSADTGRATPRGPRVHDGTIIPGNRHAGADELTLRLNRCYRPYHTALAQLAARRPDTVLVSVHSFTRQLQGRPPRPWHVGVLYAADERLSRPLIARLREEHDLCVGENEPYGGHLPGDAIARHAIAYQRPNVLLEVRNDLIEQTDDQIAWARRLAPILCDAADRAGI